MKSLAGSNAVGGGRRHMKFELETKRATLLIAWSMLLIFCSSNNEEGSTGHHKRHIGYPCLELPSRIHRYSRVQPRWTMS
ncbi:hypothetical protein OH492_11305 [Vibrio chagasii]|nr:hypothetical protein [Vibrio chagasii]